MARALKSERRVRTAAGTTASRAVNHPGIVTHDAAVLPLADLLDDKRSIFVDIGSVLSGVLEHESYQANRVDRKGREADQYNAPRRE